jgi:hypothetical protein
MLSNVSASHKEYLLLDAKHVTECSNLGRITHFLCIIVLPCHGKVALTKETTREAKLVMRMARRSHARRPVSVPCNLLPQA